MDKVAQICDAVAKARELGTYNALDRSKQYPLDTQERFRKAVNEAWTKIHRCEHRLAEKEAAIAELKRQVRRYKAQIAVLGGLIGALAVKGLEVAIRFLFVAHR
jgi:predicted  nucleic acid-binding Zn-ribbon protein